MGDETDPYLEIERRVRSCQPNAYVKGMFFESLAQRAARSGKRIGRDRYVQFQGYPLREWIEFLPQVAQTVHPSDAARTGIQKLGAIGYRTLAESTAGRVLFSMAGQNPRVAVTLIARAYKVIGSPGRVEVVEQSGGGAVIAFRDIWAFVDSWHVGALEGALRGFGIDGRVLVRRYSIENADLEVRWEK